MGRRPIIGITPCYHRDKDHLYLAQGYMEGVGRAGGLGMILPLTLEGDMPERIMETCDGFLFAGGPDIDARYFGEENLKCTGEISPQRDRLELLLAKKALERSKPMLGICRGVQLLNVALGGTLLQDIHQDTDSKGNEGASTVLKHWQEAPGWYPVHEVQISPGSMLHQIYGNSTLSVNSYHHQAVRGTGRGLKISARSSDGIIEAAESSDSRFITAVQWHPELMWKEEPLHLKLFEAFVNAAAGG